MAVQNEINVIVRVDTTYYEQAAKRATILSKEFAGIVAMGMGKAVKSLIEISDKYTALEGRLKLVTQSTADLQKVTSSLYDIARETHAEYSSTIDLYTRLANSTKQLDLSQGELLVLTESINKALIVTGTSGESANAAMVQLAKGMASGKLSSEELNSVLLHTPRLAEMIADGMGVTIGELRELSKQGKLTTEELVTALKSQASAIDEEFGEIPLTVGQAWTGLNTVLESIINDTSKSSEGTRSLADAISGVATSVENNRETIVVGLVAVADSVALIVEQLGNITEWAQANPAWAGMVLGGVVGAHFGGLHGAVVGATIGTTVGFGNAVYQNIAGPKGKTQSELEAFAGLKEPHALDEIVVTAPPCPGNGGTSQERLQRRVDALRKGLMDEKELLEEKRKEELALVDKYNKAFTDKDDEARQMRIDIAQKYKEEMAEIEGVPAFVAEIEALQEQNKTRAEIEFEEYQNKLARLEEFRMKSEEVNNRYDELRNAIEEDYAKKKQRREEEVEKTLRRMRWDTARLAINALQKFASESKAVAIAAILFNKAEQLANAKINIATAITKAYSVDPTGALAAKVATVGAVQMGIIAATGVGEVLEASKGSSSVGSSSSVATSSGNASTTLSSNEVSSNSITIYGIDRNSLYSGDQIEAIAEGLNEYMADGGKIYIK